MIKGFTLLELLVVMGIIGMLAIIALPNFMSARQRARDAQRKSDLRQIQKALELYKLDQNPPSFMDAGPGDTFPNTGSRWTNISDPTVIYMNNVPGDPSSPYYYLPDNVNLIYTLAACLENAADPEGQTCPGGFTCSSLLCYIVNQP